MSTTTTAVQTGTIPRVNLLPQEISEGAKFRTAQMAMGLAVLASFLVVGGLVYMASGDESSAQSDLANAQSTGQQLQSQLQTPTYENVPKVHAQWLTAKAQLVQAMSQEVRYSYVLNDLSLTMPTGVWLTNITATQAVDTPGSVKGAWGNAADGTVVLKGHASTLPQVAGWLQALAGQHSYTDPYLTVTNAVVAGAPESVTGYDFTSSVAISPKALSNRYTKLGN